MCIRDRALSASPAALLAGGEDLDKNFNLSNLSREDNLDWVSALSKDAVSYTHLHRRQTGSG